MHKPFVIVIPSFNNARWCEQSLVSVLSQDYPLFRVIYVDDASTDDTADLVAKHLLESPSAHRVTFIRNETRVGATCNIDRAVRSCAANEIVVLVDGDDFLAHPRVLQRLDALYQDPDVWVTWGQFTRFPQGGEGFCAPIPRDIVSANAFRDYPFVSSHLRTFYAGLYQRIRVEDVCDVDGKFFTTAGDVAQMFALMEMAGPRGKFLPEVMYLYNRENPLNDDKLDRAGQVSTEMAIREKARYGRLASLSDGSAPRELYFGTGVGRSLFENTGVLPDVDERRRPFRQLRSVLNRLGYTVRESQTLSDVENPHCIVVFDVRPEEVARLAEFPSEMLTLVLWKDPIAAPLNFDVRYHQLFGRIYTWRTDLIDNVRYFKLHFPSLRPMIDEVVAFDNRKLCTLIASSRQSDHPDELYGEERNVAQYFAEVEPDSFDLRGLGWNPAINRNYRGDVLRKVDSLRRYRFSFCYESVRGWNGFITAKIFDSFAAGCVPVYLGAPDVAGAIPKDCFIAREAFASLPELHAFLRDMSQTAHEGYLERIRAFLSSEGAALYSAEHFVRTFVGILGARATARPRSVAPAPEVGAGLAFAPEL